MTHTRPRPNHPVALTRTETVGHPLALEDIYFVKLILHLHYFTEVILIWSTKQKIRNNNSLS